MNIALILLVSLHLISLGIKIEQHGEVKEEKINAWNEFLAVIILFILYYFAFNK